MAFRLLDIGRLRLLDIGEITTRNYETGRIDVLLVN